MAAQTATILILDDHPIDRELLVSLFTYTHYRVLEAADGVEALRLVQAEHPDLVISDVLLPVMDGYEFVRRLRTDPDVARTPVIFYTAVFNEQEARDLARECGVARILSKPMDPGKILEIVAQVLQAGGTDGVSTPSADFELKHQRLLVDKLIGQVEALSRNEEELKKSRDELERRVDERTAELAAANAELKKVNQDLQDFTFIASHDLQEPLRKISAFGDRLKTKHRSCLSEEGADFLDRMIKSAERMSGLIRDLLLYSRVTTRAETLVPTDLAKIAREAAVDVELAVEQSGGHIEIGELAVVEADPNQMRQLFQNLMGNAVKYHRKQTRPTVKVYGQKENCLYRIFVEDNGIGFDEHQAEAIFRPFQRLHGRSAYEGTGMGLAICRKIVERHGGTITAKGSPDKGATFIVTLPLNC